MSKKKSFVFSTVQMKCDCFTNPKSDPKSNPQKFPISKTESWRCTGGGRHRGCMELQVEQSYRPRGCGRSSSKAATKSVSWKPLSVLEALQLIRRAAHPQFHSLHSWSYSRSLHCWRARWSLSSVQDEAWRKVEWLTSIIISLVVLIRRTRPLLSAPPVQKVKVLLRLPLSVWSEHESNPSHPARFPPSSAITAIERLSSRCSTLRGVRELDWISCDRRLGSLRVSHRSPRSQVKSALCTSDVARQQRPWVSSVCAVRGWAATSLWQRFTPLSWFLQRFDFVFNDFLFYFGGWIIPLTLSGTPAMYWTAQV